MSVYIGIEDLTANALIELISQNKDARFVSYTKLEKYGEKVISDLSSRGEKASLVLSRESTDEMLSSYPDLFEEIICKGSLGIKLKEQATVEDLIDAFRGYMSLDVLLAFINKKSTAIFGEQNV